jgi:hypothetical protein
MISYCHAYPQRGASCGEKNSQCKRNLGRCQSGNGPFRLDGEISALGKSLQSLLKKVTDTGVVKNSELHEHEDFLATKGGRSGKPKRIFGTYGSPFYCIIRPTTDLR